MKMKISISAPHQHLSFSNSLLTSPSPLFLHSKPSRLSLYTYTPPANLIIRMGGGPRTFPGGVNKWQWKRMQAKKAKQLLQARLARERQIYEMQKRAELKSTMSEHERPWEVVEKAPNLFSVGPDDQLKALADRFQKPGGFDMWSERDGPEMFETVDGLPSARFFPKGVVHSVKPYLRKGEGDGLLLGEKNLGGESEIENGSGSEDSVETTKLEMRNGKKNGVKWRRKGNRRRLDLGELGDRKQREETPMTRGSGERTHRSNSQYDMNLQRDGKYVFGQESD